MSTGRRAGLGSPTLTEVADRVFAYVQPDGSWWINNTGLLVGRHAAVSIGRVRDRSPHPRLPGGDIRGVTGLPVRTLVNTLIRPVSRSTSPQPWATWSPSTVASR